MLQLFDHKASYEYSNSQRAKLVGQYTKIFLRICLKSDTSQT
jgi:hypothetical protein